MEISGRQPGLLAGGAALCLALLGACEARAAYITLLDNGPSSNRVDKVFLGDGYTAAELDLYRTTSTRR